MFQPCASSRYQLRKSECFKHALMEIRVFQAYACGRCCDTETSRSLSLLRTCACAQVRLLPCFPQSCHTVVACRCAHSPPTRMLMPSHHHGSSSMKNIIHFQHNSRMFLYTLPVSWFWIDHSSSQHTSLMSKLFCFLSLFLAHFLTPLCLSLSSISFG